MLPLNQPNKEASARGVLKKTQATFPTSVSQHIFPVYPHDPGFVIMSPNYSVFQKPMYVHREMFSAGVSQKKKLRLSVGGFLLKLDAVTPQSLVHVVARMNHKHAGIPRRGTRR